MNRVTQGGLACGLALLLAACSSGLSDNGPLGNSGQNSGTICDWAAPGGVVQDGFEEFNDTGGTATIDKVALVHPRHSPSPPPPAASRLGGRGKRAGRQGRERVPASDQGVEAHPGGCRPPNARTRSDQRG